ncbi:sugar phosphate isomerase/epimerase family protein [Alienimonas sp. DA493]|uniref:sugar phosphate isomerase/epimerase family protein n=1 Tax=Alienimonas sp. DA493 TaxID=3373605 RepID=UPI0037552E17
MIGPSRRSFLASAAGASAAALAVGPASGVAADPLTRQADGSLFKLSLAAYSFNRQLPRGSKEGTMTLDDVVDYAASLGLPGVELTGYYFPAAVQNYEPGGEADAILHALAHRCFANGLTVSGTAIGNDFALPPGDARDAQIAACKRWIDAASVLGAPVIRIFAGKVPKGGDEKEAIARCAAGINECLPHAAEKGVHLALENHGGITATPKQMLSIIEQVDDSPWFGVNFDSGNFRTDDPYRDLAQIAPYAINAQIKVAVHPDGKKKEEADLKRIVGILGDAGYRGWLVLEYEEGGDVKTEAAKWIDKLRAAIA